jgi:M6 family metalloprotease-like protein
MYETLETFGYGRLKEKALGDLPVVVALVNVPGRAPSPSQSAAIGHPTTASDWIHKASYYDDLFFGQTDSVADYFREISNGRLNLSPAGERAYGGGRRVFGPYNLTQSEAELQLEPRFKVIKERIVADGFHPTQFDADWNGRIDERDVLTIVIDNSSQVEAAVRDSEAVRLNSSVFPNAVWAGEMVAVGHRGSLMSFCHEILHVFGVDPELYQPSGNENFGYTTMGATEFDSFDDRGSFHLDPLHAMQLLWTEPQLCPQEVSNHVVLKAQTAGVVDGAAILFDPGPRSHEKFLMVEYRSKLAGPKYDASLPTNGVAIWAIQLDEAKAPFKVFHGGSVSNDVVMGRGSRRDWHWTVELLGSPALNPRSGPLWRAGYTPRIDHGWTGRIEILPFSDSDKAVSIRLHYDHTGRRFIP